MSDLHMSDKWVCLDCNGVNDNSASRCTECRATKLFKGLTATTIKNGTEIIYSKQPTVWLLNEVVFGSGSKRKLGKCPHCNKLMFVNDIACPHCRHILSEKELEGLCAVNHFGFTYYMKSIIIWALIIAGLSYLVSS